MSEFSEELKEAEEPMQIFKVWVRFAGNGRNIKTEQPHHWRVYVEGVPYGIMLDSFSLEGQINQSNFIPETDSNGKPLTAWLKGYGDLEIRNNTAVLHLRNP